ncbi:carbohydrate sulfotransferase 11-like [Watersipora subatra]|uniref:carbohydrate sulfotransferase 11-like n=1 Tax=Watersipora subatra TaxID=2589382 RepID=UPI00355B82FC
MADWYSPTTTKAFILLLIQFTILCVLINRGTVFEQNLGSAYMKKKSPNHGYQKITPNIDNNARIVKHRVTMVRNHCDAHKKEMMAEYPDYDHSSGLLTWVWMTSQNHSLFYCATPKCGSTTWKSYLMEDLGIDWHIDTHEAARQLGVYYELPEHLKSITEFLETYRPNNRLMIVRNPWARLASAYDDKIVVKKWSLKRMCAGWKPYQQMTMPTFAQFIDCVLHNPPKVYYEGHTHPLTSLCALCHMDYNIILKLEEMDVMELYLMNLLKFKVKPKYKPPRKMKNNKYQDRYRNISAAQIAQLQHVYRYDISLFNYPQSPFD